MSNFRDWQLDLIGRQLDHDGVIAYPTEGVMGLGCLPESVVAVDYLLGLKHRSWSEGLLLVADRIGRFDEYLEGITAAETQVLREAWPGPVTFLVPDNGTAPDWIVGTHDTLGLRVSDHPVVRWLTARFGPLVSTSANISGRPAARSALEVRHYFGDGIDLIVPGRLGQLEGPSTIRHLSTGETIR